MAGFKLFPQASSMTTAHTEKQSLSDSKGGFLSALMRRNSKQPNAAMVKMDDAASQAPLDKGGLPDPYPLPPAPAHELTGSLAAAALDSLINFNTLNFRLNQSNCT